MTDEEEIAALRRMLDRLYAERSAIPRLDLIAAAETMSLAEETLGLFALLPPGEYTRQRLVDQLNSAIVAQGKGFTFGTLD